MEYDYRDTLKRELQRRSAANPLFSQRAFARKIGMTQGGLSEVLAGRRGLSPQKAEAIAAKLNFPEIESQLFLDSVASQHARSPVQRAAATAKLIDHAKTHQFTQMTNDVFETIYQWHHLAILELTKVHDFQSHPAWIADALGITATLATESIERLLRLGLLTRTRETLALTHKKLEFAGINPSDAIKNFHQQILTKAQNAIFTQSQAEREFSAVYLAIDSSEIPKAQQLLREAWRKFCAEMRDGARKDKVYCLATQFFHIQEG